MPANRDLTDRLHISTVARDRGADLARAWGVGLEVADFCTAADMDDLGRYLPPVLSAVEGVPRLTFHFPYSELCPAAIDPLVVEVTRRRYEQAFDLAYNRLGIRRMVVHSGFIPTVYFPEWFVPHSIDFWRAFLSDKPDDVVFCYENVMEDGPQLPVSVVEGVDDPRLGLCLDVGHANSQASEVPWEEWLDACAPRLAHVHLHNNHGGWDLHNPLDDGTLPMEELIGRVVERCPDATFALELFELGSSLEWLADLGFLRRPKG